MLNKLLAQVRKYQMLQPGDTLYCALSGGADSMALLWAMYLLQDKLQIRLGAAHFNHGLRGEESRRDAEFAEQFCKDYGIPFVSETGCVKPGKKGLEAAAREARYRFFDTLPGKVATAHTANDNAETVLLHLVRGTGLTGLGAIAPVNGKLIRPMLTVTRQEVEAFLREYHIPWVEDSSNGTDAFLRNRLRHHVMPLLQQENPKLAENLSAMAMELRVDAQALEHLAPEGDMCSIPYLRSCPPAIRARKLGAFLKSCGIREPERSHIALAEQLVFSQKPSACADFPEGIRIQRSYDTLQAVAPAEPLQPVPLTCPGTVELPEQNLRIVCQPATEVCRQTDRFTVLSGDSLVVRCREEGDRICLQGGSKSLKKLFIDRKIPANRRMQIPVIADAAGVVGVYSIGCDLQRLADHLPAVEIRFEKIEENSL